MPKLVILDRDGVINHESSKFIKSPDEWKPIAGSLEAIAQLSQHGYRIAVATNQSGLARGLLDMATLNLIHDKMHKAVQAAGGRIDAIFYCPHGPDDECECRKPKTGMIEDISKRYGADLTKVTAIGDSLRDLQAFANAGCQPVLVKTGNGKSTLQAAKQDTNLQLPDNTQVFDDLAAAVTNFLQAQTAHQPR